MLLAAASVLHLNLRDSWLVGDTDSDIVAGRAAGCRTILVEHSGSAHKRSAVATPDATADNLATAAGIILSAGGVN